MPEVRTFGAGAERPRAVAVGCGGAGCNALRAISPDAGLDLLAVNDQPHPSLLPFRRRLLLDRAGLEQVAAMDERAVKTLATTPEQAVAMELGDAEFVVPVAGLGGDMGSWGASLVARVAALKGAVSLAVVTTPFSVEGSLRRAVAADALKLLRTHAHGVLALSNDPLLRIAAHLPVAKALDAMARIAVQPVRDLLRVLTREDLPLLKSVLRGAGEWQLGIGEGAREHPELAAVDAAFRSPWITKPPETAREVILLVAEAEPNERIRNAIVRDVDLRTPRASVAWGAFAEAGESVRATVLLGF